VAVDWSSSDGVVLRYVLRVLWMTSRLAVMARMALRGRPDGLAVSYTCDRAESDVYECLVILCLILQS